VRIMSKGLSNEIKTPLALETYKCFN
jgi:hypothetical protein